MAGFGMLLVGPSQHLWFNFIGRILPKRDVVTTLKKLCMGQALYGPCLNGVFFSYNAALQGTLMAYNLTYNSELHSTR